MSGERAGPSVETLMARVLLVGGLLGVGLVVVGLALHAGQGGFHRHELFLSRPAGAAPPGVFTSIRQVVEGLRHRPLEPLAVCALGLVLLLGTPIVAVAVAIPAFLCAGDRRYALIAAIVLTMLVASLTVARG